MYSLLLLGTLPGQFVEHSLFTHLQQRTAFEATVRISHPASRSTGTAVIVKIQDGKTYLLTAAHLVPPEALPERLIEDPKSVELILYKAKEPDTVSSHGAARVIARMPEVDLAVLEAKLPTPPAAIPICPRDKLIVRLPMTVMTIGTLPDGPPDIVFDEVRAKKLVKKPDNTEANYWEADIPQGLGRSGGPMIDARGYVIGIASGTEHKKGYYISAGEMLRALDLENCTWLYQARLPKK